MRNRALLIPHPIIVMLKRLALMVVGWLLLFLGAAGLFLPVLPGILFLLIGLSILSVEYDWARRWVLALRQRFPAADRKIQGMLDKFAKPTSA